MKGLIILENGFEDSEGLTTYDVLKRAGFDMTTASLQDTIIKTQSGVNIKTNILLKDIIEAALEYDFLVLPGGRAVFDILDKSVEIEELIKSFNNHHKYICAICAAPMLIGKLGLLDDKTYTCFPGCERGKGKKGQDGVIVSGNIITATSMYYSVSFALTIIEEILGKNHRVKIENSLMGK